MTTTRNGQLLPSAPCAKLGAKQTSPLPVRLSLIDFLERLAAVIRRRILALVVLGSLGFVSGLVLLETEWSAFAFAAILTAIWCFGLYVFVELLTPTEPTSDARGQRVISPLRMASSRLEYLIGISFVVGWLIGLVVLTLVFVQFAW